MERFVYPRLPRFEALRELARLEGMSSEEVRATSTLTHPAAAPVATGGQVAAPEQLERIVVEVRKLADSLGFPVSLPRGGVNRFDGRCAEVLLEHMEIVPADAAHEDVWSFITMILLPDVALWRFADRSEERMIGRPRNTFRRLWWRAFVLGPVAGAPLGAEPLGEDELVNIFERPSISRSGPLVRAMATALLSLPPDTGVARSTVMRDLAKRIRRLIPVFSPDALPEIILQEVVRERLEESLIALGGQRPSQSVAVATDPQP